MSNIVHAIAIDVVRGIDQKDPRWAQWAPSYHESTEIWAFWDTRTSVQPGRNDMRLLAKRKSQGIMEGERPGQLPSPDFRGIVTTVDPEKCDSFDFGEDKVAVLKLIKPVQKTSQQTFQQILPSGQTVEYEQRVSLPQIDIEGSEVLLETNAFLLQSINESFQEKFEIAETFGEPVAFFFDKRQSVFQYGGVLFDSENWQWKERFLNDYDRYLRGTKAVENGAIVILITNSAIVRGFLLSCGIVQSDQTRGFVGFNFNMFVVDRIPIEPIEQSPEDVSEAMKEDPQSALLSINDRTTKPGSKFKEFVLSNGEIFYPSGFSEIGVGVWRFWRPTTPVSGEQKTLGFYGPPLHVSHIEFKDDVPAKYLHEVIQADIGSYGKYPRADLHTPPGKMSPPELKTSLGSTIAEKDGPVASANRFFHLGYLLGAPEALKHSISQIAKMQALAAAGNLYAEIFPAGHSPIFHDRIRKVTGMYRPGDGRFEAWGLGATATEAFEVELDKSVIAADFGLSGFFPGQRFHVNFWEDNVFTKGPGTFSELWHVIDKTTARRVGYEGGTSAQPHPEEACILEDLDGDFETQLKFYLDAGLKAFVYLPYEVVDESASIQAPTSKVEIRGIINPTRLQLGILSRSARNYSGSAQRIGGISLPSYRIVVEDTLTVTLKDAEIKKLVKNPPDGAFSNENVEVASLVRARGAIQLVKGVHYTA